MNALMWMVMLAAAGGIWPLTVAGWVGFIVSLAAAIAIPIGWGKLLEKLNGYGKRLTDVELAQSRQFERNNQFQLDIQRILDAQANEVKVMSQIDAKADACFKAVETHQKEILGRFDLFLQQKNESHTAIRERLARLEQSVEDGKKS